jgi:uncharacterized protein (TIGR03435 family)
MWNELRWKTDGRSQIPFGQRFVDMSRTIGVAVLTLAATFGQSAPPSFEVASVRPVKSGFKDRKSLTVDPGRLTYVNVSLQDCILAAYGLKAYQISGPSWLDTDRYDIAAKAADAAPEPQLMRMLKTLLAERFQLKVHHESKELSVYALVVAKNGPKLQTGDPKAAAKMDVATVPGGISFQNYSMAAFAEQLSGRIFGLERPVIDQTGLDGVYTLTLKLADSIADLKRNAEKGEAPPVFSVLQEQAGLRLAATKAPIQFLIVDHAEKAPTEN